MKNIALFIFGAFALVGILQADPVVVEKKEQCPCGCGCKFNCHCGCQEGRPCQCVRHEEPAK